MQPRSPAAILEAQEAVRSIEAIPRSELPDAEARAALIGLAASGVECHAYTPIGRTEYVIWIRPPWPWQEGRMSPAEFARRYHAGELAMGTEDGGGDRDGA
jgi:hypothetical protein